MKSRKLRKFRFGENLIEIGYPTINNGNRFIAMVEWGPSEGENCASFGDTKREVLRKLRAYVYEMKNPAFRSVKNRLEKSDAYK